MMPTEKAEVNRKPLRMVKSSTALRYNFVVFLKACEES